MIDLQVSRKQIDEIDSQIVKLFEERMKVANEVAKYKMETGKAVFDKEREEQKLDSLSKISHGKFNGCPHWRAYGRFCRSDRRMRP